MAVNWGLFQPADVAGSIMQGFQQGREQRMEGQQRNAMATYAKDPTNTANLDALAFFKPDYVVQQKQALKTQALADKDRERKQLIDASRLLGQATPENYGQLLGVAKQLGIDVSRAPPQFDPNWINSQKLITRAFIENGPELTSDAKNLVSAGYKPGTPQFEQAMVGIINNKYATDYVDAHGNIRRRSTLNIEDGPKPGDIEDGYRFKGGNRGDQNNWEKVGGPVPSAPGTFRP